MQWHVKGLTWIFYSGHMGVHGNELAEIQGRLRRVKEDTEKAILDRLQEDEDREWLDNVHTERPITSGQRKGDGRKS